MSILPLHRPRFGLAAQIPTIPAWVYGPPVLADGAVWHRVWDCGTGARLGEDPLRVLAHQPVWCRRCWPGHRCEACGFPSGPDVLCRMHNLAELDRDRVIDDAA